MQQGQSLPSMKHIFRELEVFGSDVYVWELRLDKEVEAELTHGF